MRILLTSAGITNTTIHDALVDLLGKPISESDADSDPLTGSDKALGLVDFSVFPHLEREDMPDTSLANIERWAAGLSVPAYAIDDETAIKVVDDNVEVVSEGHWKLLAPSPKATESGY